VLMNNMYNLFLRNLFRFKGRSSRKEYIARLLLTVLIFYISYITRYIDESIYDWKDEYYLLYRFYVIFGLILVMCLFISIIQYFPLAVRRLHDIGYSGWWSLVFSLACPIMILILILTPGTEEPNNYGEPPIN
jgi:uncharacterized membrane protein YhaH (DUF805 family)